MQLIVVPFVVVTLSTASAAAPNITTEVPNGVTLSTASAAATNITTEVPNGVTLSTASAAATNITTEVPNIVTLSTASTAAPNITKEVPNVSQGPPSSRTESINNLTNPSARIIAGFVVNQDMPWIVVLLNETGTFCSGSLINNQYILTAAHCVLKRFNDDCRAPLLPRNLPFQAIIGEVNYNNRKQIHQVDNFWTHPHYNHWCNNMNADIAVLKLQQPVSNSPVCLHSGSYMDNIKLYAIGYGQTHMMKGGYMSSQCKMVEVVDVDLQECGHNWGYPITANKVCTRGVQGNGGTCSRDSGGPLVIYHDSFGYIQAGVTSYGSLDKNHACNKQRPDVYGRVSSALPFIREKAGSIKTC